MINLKKAIKVLLIIVILAYLGLFFSYQNGYYEKLNEEKKVLTDEMIREYEEDLEKGIDVTSKEYVIVKPSYANVYTNSLLKISRKVEKVFDKVIKYFFNKISSQVNE